MVPTERFAIRLGMGKVPIGGLALAEGWGRANVCSFRERVSGRSLAVRADQPVNRQLVAHSIAAAHQSLAGGLGSGTVPTERFAKRLGCGDAATER